MYSIFSEPQLTDISKKRILLDTNVWRYAVDEKLSGRLVTIARRGNVQIQIAPAVIYETLRLKDNDKRDEIVSVMTNRSFVRLMPEAYSESIEILREIAKVCPGVFRKAPHFAKFERQKNDWTRKLSGFWARCRSNPSSEAHFVVSLHENLFDAARAQAQLARKEMSETGMKVRPSLGGMTALLQQETVGWNGEAVEAWRLESLNSINYHLGLGQGAYYDWLSPFIAIDQRFLRSREWVSFWLHGAKKENLPRQWLRWAHSWSQHFLKVTSGTPGDNQIFANFLDTDMIVSADKALIGILDTCRNDAPCVLPVGKKIAAGRDGVEDLIAYLYSKEGNFG
jgi:hypothetical protein